MGGPLNPDDTGGAAQGAECGCGCPPAPAPGHPGKGDTQGLWSPGRGGQRAEWAGRGVQGHTGPPGDAGTTHVTPHWHGPERPDVRSNPRVNEGLPNSRRHPQQTLAPTGVTPGSGRGQGPRGLSLSRLLHRRVAGTSGPASRVSTSGRTCSPSRGKPGSAKPGSQSGVGGGQGHQPRHRPRSSPR